MKAIVEFTVDVKNDDPQSFQSFVSKLLRSYEKHIDTTEDDFEIVGFKIIEEGSK